MNAAASTVQDASTNRCSDGQEGLHRFHPTCRSRHGRHRLSQAVGAGVPEGCVDHARSLANRYGSKLMIITVANLRGGVGKSTLSVHLAAWLHDRGHHVILAYRGTQQSSAEWIRIERNL